VFSASALDKSEPFADLPTLMKIDDDKSFDEKQKMEIV